MAAKLKEWAQNQQENSSGQMNDLFNIQGAFISQKACTNRKTSLTEHENQHTGNNHL